VKQRVRMVVFTLMLSAGLYGQEPQVERPVSWGKLAPNLLNDQKRIWTFPVQVARGHHIVPVLAVVVVTAALVATDANAADHFRRTDVFHGMNNVLTGTVTGAALGIAPASLYIAGLARKDGYEQRTALLATEALADAEVVAVVVKALGRRRKPDTYPAGEKPVDSWFNASGPVLKGIGSFPSNHTVAAFAVATVISRRYPHRRWVPYVAYGLSGVIGFSRLALSAHFPSDIFMGAALGYGIGRFAVLRQ
jgi:hypothetical protein